MSFNANFYGGAGKCPGGANVLHSIKTSIQDLLRVENEPHTLDITVGHEEIDSIKNRLDYINSVISGTDTDIISSSETSLVLISNRILFKRWY